MASSSENMGTPLEEEQPQAPPTPNLEPTEAEEEPQTLERTQELFDRGAKAIEGEDFIEAVDCLSQALEIRLGFPFSLIGPNSLLLAQAEQRRFLLCVAVAG